MTTPLSTRHKISKFVLMVGSLILLAGIILAVLEKTHVIDVIKMPSKPARQKGPTKAQLEQQAKADVKAKQDYLDSAVKPSGKDNTTNTDTANTTSTQTLSLSASQNNNTVVVLSQIQGVSTGTCALTATNGSQSISQSATVIYQPEFSSCAGFSIPASALGAGVWTLSVTVTPNSGAALTKSTTLEVK